MATTPAGLAEFKRSMITRFNGKCEFCGTATTAGIDYAALNGKWFAACVACAASVPARISRITSERIAKVQDKLTPEQLATLTIPVGLADAIGGTLTEFETRCVAQEMLTLARTVEAMTTVEEKVTSDLITGRIYTVNGVHYRIKESKVGNQYAMRLVVSEGRKPSWDYDRGAISTVRRSGTLMTAEDAAAIGHMTHHCCFCSLELTDERSTVVGYGPICAGKHALPWG